MDRRVLIVSEGKHELATDPSESSLAEFVRRLVPDPVTVRAECRDIRQFTRRIHGRGDRYARKFIAILDEAQKLGFNAAVIVVDCDRDRTRIGSATTAQQSDHVGLPRAVAVAIETYDAWFLGDHVALSDVLNATIDMQPLPENLTDPKSQIQKLRDEHVFDGSLSRLYFLLAVCCRIEHVVERCPGGFAVFVQRVREMGQSLAGG